MTATYFGYGVLLVGAMIVIISLGVSVYRLALASKPNRIEANSEKHDSLMDWTLAGLLTAIAGLVIIIISMLATGRL